jgi:hypothetical protein
MPKPPIPQKVTPQAQEPALVAKFIPPWQSGQAGAVVAMVPPTDDPGEAYAFGHIHPRTKVLRKLFVAEFVKDFNGTAAMARLGFEFSQPAVMVNKWMNEPYTQYLLDQFIREAEQSSLVTRNAVTAALVREANSYGLDCSGASRVSALGKLAKILGMEITNIKADVAVAGGIMLVPLATNSDDWEKNAAAAQANLKANANR